MNRYVELSMNVMVGGIASTGDLIAQVTARIQERFRRSNQQRLNRELNVRRDERSKERERIARELHDTLFQGFLGASLLLHRAVEETPADSPTKRSLSHALCLMDRAIQEGRVALQGLLSSGIVSTSLEQAFSGLGDEFTSGTGIRFRVLVTGKPSALKLTVQEQIYIIGREAVVNALRHSGATDIEVEVEHLRGRLRVAVRDNGCGIDPKVIQSGQDSHLGLAGMQKRAEIIGAQLQVWSRPRGGTVVDISIPIGIVADGSA